MSRIIVQIFIVIYNPLSHFITAQIWSNRIRYSTVQAITGQRPSCWNYYRTLLSLSCLVAKAMQSRRNLSYGSDVYAAYVKAVPRKKCQGG